MNNLDLEIFNGIAIAVSISGSAVIVWSVIITIFKFIKSEITHIWTKKDVIKEMEQIRIRFGSYLLLGLDFMLAADIIHTIHNPALNELYVLALIVGIRSVISYFLTKEMKESSVQ